MESVYEKDIGVIVKQVRDRQHQCYDDRTARMQARIRETFFALTNIPVDLPLLSYGEQPDPPIVKNTAKSVLAAVIQRRLHEEGIVSVNVSDVLFSDSFGSNFEVFKAWNFFARNKAENLGQQTYGKAPHPPGYRQRLRQVLLEAASPDQKAAVEAIEEHEETIGGINRAYRVALEEHILPFSVQRTSLSALEDALREDPAFVQELLSYSGQVGKLGKGFFVLWKGEPKPLDPTTKREWTDTGYRRYFARNEGETFGIIPPYGSASPVYTGSLGEVLCHPQVESVSFDASTRAVICYLLANTGVNITGGGSTYNEVVARTYMESGFPMPLICHLPVLEELGSKPLSVLLGRRERITHLIEHAGRIQTTDATEFVETLGGK